MRFGVYAIRDEAAAGFTAPTIFAYDEMAIRDFQMTCKKQDVFIFKPGDFSLWCIGEYDNDTGMLYPVQPKLLIRGDRDGEKG